MAHPVVWPKKSSFHPISDSPPVCLTQDLSPERTAEILLLSCGDPGSILYTVFTDLAPKYRLLDITCCDWEPAVLARNILLLTMIVDGVEMEAAWSVFYHFFLEKTSHDTLMSQCHTLIHSSSTMKTWRECKYGRFLRFCTEKSLAEIRRHWVLYLKSQNDTEEERKALKNSFSSGMKSVHDVYGDLMDPSRAAGPLFFYMLTDGHASQSHNSFWTTGVTSSKLSQEAKPTPYVNPTFAYSVAGKKFNVHYSTDPIMAFYLAPAFASGTGGRQRLSKSLITDDFMECAKSQFSAWCSSFRARLSSGSAANIILRFFVGESLALCRALHVCKEQKTTETGIYAHPWRGSPIVFDIDYDSSSTTPAPLLFNVVETSDLADHVGIVNLMVATVPLLQQTPWSIIYTFTSLWSYPGNSPQSTLSNSVCGDVPTFSMLLRVAPSPNLWHFTSHSNKHGIIGPNRIPCELHESISWRFISSFIPNTLPASEDTNMAYFNFICDEHTLARYLFAIYLRMFADENSINATRNKGHTLNLNKQDLAAVHYIRASFVALLALVKGSVRLEWTQTMNHLIDLIGNDKSLAIGMNSYQDLSCHLHLRDVHTLPVLALDVEPLRTSQDRFQGWKDVPPIVCVVLKVPRQRLKRMEIMDADEIVTPMLQCEIHGSTFHDIYSSIHFTFGDTLLSTVNGESQVIVKEDPHGWSGTSPLIVTFYVPSWTLTNAPTATLVGLHFRGSLSTPSLLMMACLGRDLTIFSTSLMDKSHVQVVRCRPNNAQEIKHLCNTNGYNTPSASANIEDITMKFSPKGDKAISLITRKDITESNAARELAGGSKVLTQPLSDSSALVTFGDYAYRFRFPFAVRIDRLLTRIDRKSSYIEIESLIRTDFNDLRNPSLNPFAVAYDHNQINLLNIHYLNLDTLPDMRTLRKGSRNQWLTLHATMMFSGSERRERETFTNTEERTPLVNLKGSIMMMLVKYVKSAQNNQRERSSVFCLTDPGKCDNDILFFVNAIKLDLGAHTVVIDACAVSLAAGLVIKLPRALERLKNKGVAIINTSVNEIGAWKLLMPTLSERCRTWKHTEACEYRTKGIPASLEGLLASPLCSCGKGKNLGWFGTVAEWAPFHKEATRVAIGPLFTFSFIEDTLRAVATEKTSVAILQKKLCARCGRIGGATLRSCAACMKARYCSPECQKAHWTTHKPACISARGSA